MSNYKGHAESKKQNLFRVVRDNIYKDERILNYDYIVQQRFWK